VEKEARPALAGIRSTDSQGQAVQRLPLERAVDCLAVGSDRQGPFRPFARRKRKGHLTSAAPNSGERHQCARIVRNRRGIRNDVVPATNDPAPADDRKNLAHVELDRGRDPPPRGALQNKRPRVIALRGELLALIERREACACSIARTSSTATAVRWATSGRRGRPRARPPASPVGSSTTCAAPPSPTSLRRRAGAGRHGRQRSPHARHLRPLQHRE